MLKYQWQAETPAVRTQQRSHRIAAFLTLWLLGAALATTQSFNPRATPGKQPDGTYLVETEQRVKPWGTQTVIEGRPVDLAFDDKLGLLAVLRSSNIELRNAATSQLIGSFSIKGASYAGIAFRPQTQEVWASEGTRSGEDSVFIGKFSAQGHPTGDRRLKLKDHAVPIGLSFSPDGHTAYIVLSRHNAIGVYDADTLELKREIPVGLAPFALLITPDGHRLFVTNRGHKPQPSAITADSAGTSLGTDRKSGAVLNGSITAIDLPSLARRDFPTGQAPAGLALRSDGKVLAVANAYSGTISIFNLLSGTATETNIELAPHSAFGSQPIGCAFSADGKWLYVAAAGLNAVAVLQQQKEAYTLSGLLPAGWYPSALQLIGGDLQVVNIKGDGSTLAPEGGHRARAFHGSLRNIPAGFEQHLSEGTAEVRQYNSALTNTNAVNSRPLGIQHVLLLVKENRTYDQVFGDLPQGNGDPKYLMYGRPITPNHHALAEQYVLFDNFYATGAISLDGHQWLEQGFVGDHVERALTTSPRGYAWDLSDALDVSPAGVFWQNPTHPLTVRFGGILSLPAEFQPTTQLTRDIDENDLHPWHFYWDAYQAHRWEGLVGSRAAVPALAPYVEHRYPVNSMKIPDQIRASVIQQEFAEAERTGNLPELMAFGMTSDHTMGTDPNAPKPEAMVADNDLALGRMWSRTATSGVPP